ncbi:MAG: thioredoxin family protein [Candidatus Micrarchaeia archaeon]
MGTSFKAGSNKLPLIVGMVILLALLVVAVYFLIQVIGESFSNAQSGVGFDEEAQSGYETGIGANGSVSVKQCLSSKGYTGFVFIYSTSCPHCRNMMPIIDALSGRRYNITKVNVADSGKINEIMACVKLQPYVPQFLCTNNGEIEIGEMSEQEVIDLYGKCTNS